MLSLSSLPSLEVEEVELGRQAVTSLAGLLQLLHLPVGGVRALPVSLLSALSSSL